MKILVCGDRAWKNKTAIQRELAKFPPGTEVVHGACEGVDRIGGEIARELGFRVHEYPADWAAFGKRAGPLRNRMMLREHPDIELILAFHANIKKSKGTKDMIRAGITEGVRYRLVAS